MNDKTIEQLLRKAPQVQVPEDLRDQLERDIELSIARPLINEQRSPATTAWIRRWLPAMSIGAWFFVGTVVFAVQAVRISELREQNRIRQASERSAAEEVQAANEARAAAAAEREQLKRDLADVQRLRAEVEQLRAEAAELATLRAQNQQLREELKTQAKLPIKPEEDFFATASERATRIKCINNIKQVGLAARIWANDHGRDTLPDDYDAMKKELANEKLTFCPKGDRYEILSPGASELQPDTVYIRCRIHNNVGLADGSAQQLSEAHQVVQRNGKWIIVRNEFE